MKVYIAYGSVSAVMLLITILFYSYKNWMALRKNAIYIWLLLWAFLAVSADVVLGYMSLEYLGDKETLDAVSGIIMSVCMLVLYLSIFLYDMAVTGRMRLVRTPIFCIFLGIIALAGIFSVISPWLGLSTFSYPNQDNYGARGNMLQAAVIAICLCSGILVLFQGRKRLSKRVFYVLAISQALLLFDAAMQVVLKARNLSSYYTLAGVLISYYILLHNMDQYRSFSSFCFDRDGFHEVLLERAYYKEDFVCLGICINNIESITNFCTEAEIVQIHKRMGKILRSICGRHNVYHIHSFEYMILLRGKDNAEKKHQILEKKIPSYFRIHNKNIALLCGFYTVRFADAAYNAAEFQRTITSMRKLTMEQMGRDNLLSYQGENQEGIKHDLEALRVVSQCIAARHFHFAFVPIQSVADRNDVSYEFVLQEYLEDGTEISQESIWSLAAETGYIREAGQIAVEMMCKVVKKNRMLEKSDAVYHINLLSSQLANTSLAEQYVRMFKAYDIPGKRICVELTIDQRADEEKLEESFALLRDYGMSILLDHFGVIVCNLKNVLNMSFDSVKINSHMVKTYCDGKNSLLRYMANMLNARNWILYLDGIDSMEMLLYLSDMKVDYIQGPAVKAADFVPSSTSSDGALQDGAVGGEPVHV